jgi:ribose 1,5-bisphosphokinase
LYYVMGPAGAGKLSVLSWVREHGVPLGVVCAQRYATGLAATGLEQHVLLGDEEFAAREQRGLFVLTWSQSERRYAIGREVEHWMQRGADVLVNGSCSALASAQHRFPHLQPVVITARPETLAARMPAQDAEDDIAIFPTPGGAWVIQNEASLAHAGSQLLDAIRLRQAG